MGRERSKLRPSILEDVYFYLYRYTHVVVPPTIFTKLKNPLFYLLFYRAI